MSAAVTPPKNTPARTRPAPTTLPAEERHRAGERGRVKGCVGMEAPCCCGGQFMSAGQLGRLLGAGTAGAADRTVSRGQGPDHRTVAWPGWQDRPRSRGDRTEREAGWAGDPRHPYDRAGRTVAAPCGLCAAYSEAHHRLTGQVPKLNHLFPRPHHSPPAPHSDGHQHPPRAIPQISIRIRADSPNPSPSNHPSSTPRCPHFHHRCPLAERRRQPGGRPHGPP